MTSKRNFTIGGSLLAAILLLGYGQWLIEPSADAATEKAPAFEVDPLWPKPLPNHWILGSAIGVGVDSRDHVFVIHRRDSFNPRTEIGAATDPMTSECCIPAPNILEFDPAGNLVNSWGGRSDEYEWPSSNHGLTLDHKDNVWIGGNGQGDSHILKFTRDGRVPPADRHTRHGSGFKQHRAFRPSRQDRLRCRRQRSLCGRRLRQQAGRGAGYRYRRAKTLLGRLRQHAG